MKKTNRKPAIERIFVVTEFDGERKIFESEDEITEALDCGDLEYENIDSVKVYNFVDTMELVEEKTYRLMYADMP